MSYLSNMTRRLAGCALILILAACAAPPAPRSTPEAPPERPIRYVASFYCEDTQSTLQDIVCENKALAALDLDMTQAFRSNMRTLDSFGRAQLMADQRQWLLRRHSQCRMPVGRGVTAAAGAADCLKKMYHARIAQLVAWPQPQARPRPGEHPLAAYIEFHLVDDREPALCSAFGKQFNEAIAARGNVDPSHIDGFTELAGSHGPASLLREGHNIEVKIYDAGAYASFQLRAKGLVGDGQTFLHDKSLPDWIRELPNAGGSFSASSSQTSDYAAIDVFRAKGREFALVIETWGYYAAAARGESPHAGVYELVEGGLDLKPLCLYRTYLTPPTARIFDRMPAFKDLRDTLRAMSGELPAGLVGDDRRDEALFESEVQWTLFSMPLVALDEIERFGRKGSLRRRHDAALEAIFAWSERNLPSKLLYRRLMPMLQSTHAELIRAFRSTQGLKPDEAVAAADLFLMAVVDHAAENLVEDLSPAIAPTDYMPRYAAVPALGDLEKNRPYTSLHSAALNRASSEVVADFIKFESGTSAPIRGRGPAGDTVLMAAVRSPETVAQLLAAGADVKAYNNWHKTALMTAAQTNQLASAQLLLDAGADVQRPTIKWHAEGAGGPDNEEGATSGRTALMYAAAGASPPLVQLLLDRGAANVSDDRGVTACDYLAQNKILTEAERGGLRSTLCGMKVVQSQYKDENPAPAATSLSQVESPVPKLGNTWTYALLDKNSKAEVRILELAVTEVNDAQIRLTDNVNSEVSVYDKNWALVQLGNQKYSPPNQWISFPLQVGKKWESSTSYIAPQCGTTALETKSRIVGWEDVTVPAGSFRALRTDSNGSWKNICGKGRVDSKFWYDPNVKWIVKSITDISIDNARPGSQPIGWIQELKAFNVDR